MDNNTIVHSFNNSSRDQLINSVDNSRPLPFVSGSLNELRMHRPNLTDVLPAPIPQRSFRCRRVKWFEQSKSVIFEYDIRFQNNVNWIAARNKFEDFLHRKLGLDRPSILIEGIMSRTETYYIINDADGLVMNALRSMGQNDDGSFRRFCNQISEKFESNGAKLTAAGVLALGAFALLKFVSH